MPAANQLPTRPLERLERIKASRARIAAKLEANPKHHNAEGYKARIEEYDSTIEELELLGQVEELRKKRAGDVTVGVPAGKMSVKGQGGSA